MPKDGGGHAGYHLSFSVFSVHLLHFFSPIISLGCCSWVSHAIITGSISQHPSFSFNHLSALFVLLSHTYSISSLASLLCLHRFRSPSYWEAAMLSYNLDNAGCCVCVCVLVLLCARMCVCVCLSLRDRCKDLALIQPATHVGPTNRGRKDKCSPGKTKLNTFLWNIAATGAEIT